MKLGLVQQEHWSLHGMRRTERFSAHLNRLKFRSRQSCNVKNCRCSFGSARQPSPEKYSMGTIFSSHIISSVGQRGISLSASSWEGRLSWRDISNSRIISLLNDSFFSSTLLLSFSLSSSIGGGSRFKQAAISCNFLSVKGLKCDSRLCRVSAKKKSRFSYSGNMTERKCKLDPF